MLYKLLRQWWWWWSSRQIKPHHHPRATRRDLKLILAEKLTPDQPAGHHMWLKNMSTTFLGWFTKFWLVVEPYPSEKYEFINGKDDNPYMKWKIKAMFQTTNQTKFGTEFHQPVVGAHHHTTPAQNFVNSLPPLTPPIRTMPTRKSSSSGLWDWLTESSLLVNSPFLLVMLPSGKLT